MLHYISDDVDTIRYIKKQVGANKIQISHFISVEGL